MDYREVLMTLLREASQKGWDEIELIRGYRMYTLNVERALAILCKEMRNKNETDEVQHLVHNGDFIGCQGVVVHRRTTR